MLTDLPMTLHFMSPTQQDSAHPSASSQGETRTDSATASTQWLQDNPEPLLGPGGSSRRSHSSQPSPGSLAHADRWEDENCFHLGLSLRKQPSLPDEEHRLGA